MRDGCRSSSELLDNHERVADSKRSGLVVMLAAALSVFSTALMPGCSQSSGHSTTYMRLNQVGYESGMPMRAYLMTETAPTGTRFTIKRSDGEVVFSGALGVAGGVWGKYKVYPMDFTTATAGAYSLSVSEPMQAPSSSFRVDTAAQLYSSPLNNALQFFQNQRDGSDYIPSALRTASAHLNDRRGNVYRPPEG
jgi:endoglucanase